MKSWMDKGFSVYYVRFHQPVPPSVNTEPVSEFNTQDSKKQAKYLIEKMYYTPQGLIWYAKGEVNIVPLANVIYARWLRDEEGPLE